MRRNLPSIFLIVVLAIPFTAMLSFAEGIIIKAGFTTGNNFMALSSDEQEEYAMGLVDGILLAPFFDAPKEKMGRLESGSSGESKR